MRRLLTSMNKSVVLPIPGRQPSQIMKPYGMLSAILRMEDLDGDGCNPTVEQEVDVLHI